MADHSCPGLHETDGQQRHRPVDDAGHVLGGDALVDGLAEDGGDEGLPAHPDDPGGDPAEHRGLLALEDPPEIGRRGAQLRGAGVSQRESAHERPR